MRLLVVCCLLMAAAPARAERLPIHLYTTADGLANNRVDHGTRDGHGFLWFATLDGVSRFDGEHFTSFGVADGLLDSETHEVLATRDDVLWVGTDGGLAWLDLRERVARPRFHALATHDVLSFREDADGTLWAGTSGGLMRVDRKAGVKLEPIAVREGRQPQILAIVADARDRSLWLGTSWGLVHRRADGSVEQFRIAGRADADDRVFSLALDRKNRLWIGGVGRTVIAAQLPLAPTQESLWEAAERGGSLLRYQPQGAARRKIIEDSRGTIWIGTTVHLVKFEHDTFTELTAEQLGANDALGPCLEDAAGNLWFGGAGAGALRLADHGFISYPIEELGATLESVVGFTLDRDGALYLFANGAEGFLIGRREGEQFVTLRPRPVPMGGWGWGQVAVIDRDDRWWHPTALGVVRYPKLARFEDLATAVPEIFGTSAGLRGKDIFRIYEDRRGDVWISTLTQIGLARWDRKTNAIANVGDNWPDGIAMTFAEDRDGSLWIGYSTGVLARVRDGVPERIDGMPISEIEWVTVDHANRVWVATARAGVVRLDDITAPKPRITRYTMREGLGTDKTKSVVEDGTGRIYIGTTSGIDWIDPQTQNVGHYGIADGLLNDYVHAAFRDRDNTLWFGTRSGAAHLVPEGQRTVPRAPVYITRLVIAGKPRAIAAGGDASVPALELDPDERDLDIDFASPSFVTGEVVRYEYRLGDGAWSELGGHHEVHFAQLSAGDYRFEARARYPDGTSSAAARFAFVIRPPVWQRWWFIALCTIVLSAAVYIAYRRRLAHILAIERVRTRIATDLHDDLGSSLSRIAILSDVASRRAAAHEDIEGPIGDIGRSARELVDVASDIVWSTDPKRDNLGSVIIRLRVFAAGVLEGRDIAWTLTAPPDPERIELDPDRRRHLYMVIKEAINNAQRHAEPRHVAISITCPGSTVEARIRDDGKGFDPEAPRDGNGVSNMRARATEAGGTLDVVSDDGGTEIVLRVPLHASTHSRVR